MFYKYMCQDMWFTVFYDLILKESLTKSIAKNTQIRWKDIKKHELKRDKIYKKMK